MNKSLIGFFITDKGSTGSYYFLSTNTNPTIDIIEIANDTPNPIYLCFVTNVKAKQNIPIIKINNIAPNISNFVLFITKRLCSHNGKQLHIDNILNIASIKNLY